MGSLNDNNGDHISPDDPSAEDLAAIRKAQQRRAAWRRKRKDIPPIELRHPRLTELDEFPTPRTGD